MKTFSSSRVLGFFFLKVFETNIVYHITSKKHYAKLTEFNVYILKGEVILGKQFVLFSL